jgi:hypothetical protein
VEIAVHVLMEDVTQCRIDGGNTHYISGSAMIQ